MGKRKKSVLLLAAVLVLLCTVPMSIPSDAASPTQIDTPYVYPLQPGTPEWKATISRMERAAACQIPEDILPAMTTRALAETVLNYPFMVDLYVWNTTSIGFQALLEDFNGLRELVSRPDGLEVLRQIQQEPRTPSQDGSSMPTRYLETLIEEMSRHEIQTSPLTAPKAALSLPSTPAGRIIYDAYYDLTWEDHNTASQTQN